MASLLITACNCCKKTCVPCVVIEAGILPRMSTCRDCDNTGTYLKLSTYRKN